MLGICLETFLEAKGALHSFPAVGKNEPICAKVISLKVIVVVIRTNPFFGMTMTHMGKTDQISELVYNLQPSQIIFYSRCHIKRRIGRAPTPPILLLV